MSRKNVTSGLRSRLPIGLIAFLIGWIFAAFVLGTPLNVNPILIAAVVLAIILVLKILARGDALFIAIGIIIGVVLTLLVPAASPKFLDPGLMFIALLFLMTAV
jgi:hypothetical protein